MTSQNQSPIEIALYQPDIPQNTGTILRLGACLDLVIHIIEPAGFLLTDKALKRAGMDYLDQSVMVRHRSFEAFDTFTRDRKKRLILLTTKATRSYLDHACMAQDIFLFGRESIGVPDAIHARADKRLTIPMNPNARSLNLAMSVAMVTGEVIRQTRE